MTGLVGVFLPFGRTMDMIYAGGGTLLFSGYVVFDTYMINNRLSPDEYIMAAISLYLDFINLCTSVSSSFVFVPMLIVALFCSVINILRLLNDLQER